MNANFLMDYVSPEVEVLVVTVEMGFATSPHPDWNPSFPELPPAAW